jgi:hypothetical protein
VVKVIRTRVEFAHGLPLVILVTRAADIVITEGLTRSLVGNGKGGQVDACSTGAVATASSRRHHIVRDARGWSAGGASGWPDSRALRGPVGWATGRAGGGALRRPVCWSWRWWWWWCCTRQLLKAKALSDGSCVIVVASSSVQLTLAVPRVILKARAHGTVAACVLTLSLG